MAFNIINGTEDDDHELYGTDADDLIRGFRGNDYLFGGAGNDQLYGGLGRDLLEGDEGDDTLNGGAGDDRLVAGDGDNVLFGGDGRDALTLWQSPEGSGRNLYYGGNGRDFIQVGGPATGEVYGGDGHDVLEYSVSGNHVQLSIGPDGLGGADAPDLSFEGIEEIRLFILGGTAEINGSDQRDFIILRNERSEAFAGGGNDLVEYSANGLAHVLDGGEGRDHLDVILYPNQSPMTFNVTAGSAVDYGGSLITGFEVYSVRVSLGTEPIEVRLGPRNDTVEGGRGNDIIGGRDGNDLLFGGDGGDTVYGAHGSDTLYGGLGEDLLFGGFGDDFLYAGSGDSTLYGGAGHDWLAGGDSGADVFRGGAGADRFDLGRALAVDLILDFETGTDQIGLSRSAIQNALPANALPDIGEGGPTGAAKQFYITFASGRSQLIWDENGTGPDGTTILAEFSGVVDLAAGDLVIL